MKFWKNATKLALPASQMLDTYLTTRFCKRDARLAYRDNQLPSGASILGPVLSERFFSESTLYGEVRIYLCTRVFRIYPP